MTGLLGLTLLSLLALCLSIALHVRLRTKADELRAVIRAQRRCMDQMETELRGAHGKGTNGVGKRDNPGRRARQVGLDRGSGPLLNQRRSYPIEPSAN
jgi:hypothetical protein